MKKKITIFGHSGYLGNHFKNFINKKKYKIFLPKRNSLKFKNNLGYVFYFVGTDEKKDIQKQLNSNFLHLLKIIGEIKFKTFTYISSTRIYIDNINNKINENDNFKISLKNKNIFNLLKLLSEKLVLSKNNTKVIRLSNVYGKDLNNSSMLSYILKDAKFKRKIFVKVNKYSSKDYIFLNDALDIIYRISFKGKHKVYNLASGKKISIKKIAEVLKKKYNAKIMHTNQKIKEYYPQIDNSLIKKEFKFKPTKDLIDYLKSL